MNKIIIAIGRSKGSGGQYIGELLAERLGIKCYDREILNETARESGFAKEFIEQYEEKKPSSLLYSLAMGTTMYNQPLQQQLFISQAKVIKEIAARESCIFIGRCADYVLRDEPDLLSVFVHAPIQDCVKRVKLTSDIPQPEAELMIKQTNKSRAEYYRYFTDRIWGNYKNYHLSLNSSDLTAEGAADLILEYLNLRWKYRNR